MLCMLKPKPQYEGVGRWGFGDRLGHECGALASVITTLVKEAPGASPNPSDFCGHSKKIEPGGRSSPSTKSAGAFLLNSQPPEPWEMNVCLEASGIYQPMVFCYSSQMDWDSEFSNPWARKSWPPSFKILDTCLQKRKHSTYLLVSILLRLCLDNSEEEWKTEVIKMCARSLQSRLTLCGPMDCSPPGSSVQGILQARILEWVAMPFSRGSSWPGVKPTTLMSPALTSGFFTTELPGKPWSD